MINGDNGIFVLLVVNFLINIISLEVDVFKVFGFFNMGQVFVLEIMVE